ncbi:MarC family protein [Rhizobiales bacterium TNE-4]|nr:MarC family protein [Rhizobiales bacterium TNE-4]MBV1826806.1 MarC family protein [Rhizobiales bacterium TNE-4]
MLPDFIISALVTLIVTVDPPGLAPIFLSLTPGMSAASRRKVAVRAVLIAFVIMTATALGGAPLINALGITLPAFRIAGGLLLFTIAYQMVFGGGPERKAETAEKAITEDHIRNIAAFPLGIPLMAGPGAITAILLLSGRAQGDPIKVTILIGVIALVVLACLISFLLATRIARLLGVTGNIVLTRLLGVILAAMAVQFVIDGVKAIMAG